MLELVRHPLGLAVPDRAVARGQPSTQPPAADPEALLPGRRVVAPPGGRGDDAPAHPRGMPPARACFAFGDVAALGKRRPGRPAREPSGPARIAIGRRSLLVVAGRRPCTRSVLRRRCTAARALGPARSAVPVSCHAPDPPRRKITIYNWSTRGPRTGSPWTRRGLHSTLWPRERGDHQPPKSCSAPIATSTRSPP